MSTDLRGPHPSVPEHSVIVVSYRDTPIVNAFLGTLDRVALPATEVLVVRNNWRSSDPPLAGTSRIEVVEERSAENLGFARGFNLALGRARGRTVLSLNADTQPTAELLELLSKTLCARDEAPLLVAPALCNERGRVLGRRFYSLASLVLSRLPFASHLTYVKEDPSQVHWVLGACFAMRTEELRALGGLDPRFFLYFEDVDLCWRIWAAGGLVAVCDTHDLVHHHGRASRRLLSRPLLWHLRSAAAFFAKHPKALFGVHPVPS